MLEDLIVRITKNQLFGIGGVIGLLGFTYLARRYLNNTEKTSNSYYIKDLLGKTLKINNIGRKKIYIFWNGSISSTYLLLDLLEQDYIIQPLYIERYSIIKKLYGDYLEEIAVKYSNKIDSKEYEYLKDIARLRKKQNNELLELDNKRKMILNKYSEFINNLLPIYYITSIEKDLDFTSNFFLLLNNIKTLHYDGIELLEQMIRFIKNCNEIKQNIQKMNNINNMNTRIIIGYNKDSKNIILINEILNKMQTKINIEIVNNIELPLKEVHLDEIKYKIKEMRI